MIRSYQSIIQFYINDVLVRLGLRLIMVGNKFEISRGIGLKVRNTMIDNNAT